jgi:hypothetical protein
MISKFAKIACNEFILLKRPGGKNTETTVWNTGLAKVQP